MEKPQVPTGAIVVGVQDTDEAAAALEWALRQARTTHQPLTLVHAIGDEIAAWSGAGADDAEVPLGSISLAGRELLARTRARIASTDPELRVTEALRNTGPGAALTAEAMDADVLVVGTHHEHAHRTGVLDPIARLLRDGVSCPITEVGPSSTIDRPEILVVVDGSVRARRTLEYAFRRGELSGLPLTVAVIALDSVAGELETITPSSFEIYLVKLICGACSKLVPGSRYQVLTEPSVVKDSLEQGRNRYREVILEEHRVALVALELYGTATPQDAVETTTVLPFDHAVPDCQDLLAGACDVERQVAELLLELHQLEERDKVGNPHPNQCLVPVRMPAKHRPFARSRTVD
jgi:nucleotide-binding universal stress UspA family protein